MQYIILVLTICCVVMIPIREQLIHSKTAATAVLVRDSFPVNTTTNCSSNWGLFVRNQSILIETQVILPRHAPPPAFNVSIVDDSLFHGLFIFPSHNFAFCAIPKNAVTQWKTVLRNVFGNVTTTGFTSPAFGIGKASQQKYGVKATKDIMESPTRTVAVMVRDPLARFASVYLNKCFDLNCSSSYCLPRVSNNTLESGQPISFRQALDWILSDNVNVATIDRHWALQSEQCGMKNGGLDSYFTIIGKMNKETLNVDAACIMERAGLAKYNIGVNGTPFWESGGVTSKQYRTESEEEVLRKLFTPETARKFIIKFRQDYETFQLPEPDWVSRATGEWMDSFNHHSCKGRAW